MTSMLAPVLALIILTLLVWIWMYATRIPAMRKVGSKPRETRLPGSLIGLPASARRVADNYNRLLEQPTIFYALVFYIILSGHSDRPHIILAWTYVGLRVIHTLSQCTVNSANLRFQLFALSSFVLMVMAGRELLLLL